ncbi:hypothetical protein ACFLZ8_03470 [Planctomycetota bacterium]
MDSGKDGLFWRFKWHIVLIFAVVLVVVALTLYTDIFKSSEVRQLVLLLGVLVVLSALLTMLSRIIKIFHALRDNSNKLEELTSSLEKIHSGLKQIHQSTRISDAAKSIAYRDEDKKSLREVVFEKLQSQDFNGANQIIEEISKHREYEDLAHELKTQAVEYRDASDQERLNQIINHIEKLLDDCQWVRASAQIEGIIKTNPDNLKALSMREILMDKKDERKKILLAAWDDAVKQQETDRSLDILRELDHYLTPNEALALQEAARDIFRTKLHNLGVRFSLAVTEKQWTGALEIGQQIMKDFPNSKMSEEIRDKLDVLRTNVQMQNN